LRIQRHLTSHVIHTTQHPDLLSSSPLDVMSHSFTRTIVLTGVSLSITTVQAMTRSQVLTLRPEDRRLCRNALRIVQLHRSSNSLYMHKGAIYPSRPQLVWTPLLSLQLEPQNLICGLWPIGYDLWVMATPSSHHTARQNRRRD
jgi:hypothetical protein